MLLRVNVNTLFVVVVAVALIATSITNINAIIINDNDVVILEV